MKILVNEMPKKKEECLFYIKKYVPRFDECRDYCRVNERPCTFKNGDSVFGGECRCLRVK